jgi:cation transport ATPase
MQQQFRIDGMHCNGCVARVSKALASIADDVQKAVKKAGDYVVTPA